MKIDIADRFWKRVEKTESCWIWKGSQDKDGYPIFDSNYKHSCRAHRFSYFLHYGEIPKGMSVCHTCDNRMCVNPAHFFLGTQQDNVKDRQNKNRQAKGILCGGTKLTEEDVIKIRKLNASFGNPRKIAATFNVTYVTIWDIVTYRTWKHIA